MKKFIAGTVFFVLVFVVTTFAQMPPHPNGGIGPGSGNVPVGGGAPIEGGLLIMLSLALGYGARRIYEMRKQGLDENQ